jgi:sialidase-1
MRLRMIRALVLGAVLAASAPGQSHHAAATPEVLFRSAEASYYCFRIPALVPAGGDTLLAFAEARRTNCEDSDAIDLVMKRSVDGGKTWSELQVLFHEGNRSVNQPAPIYDRQTGVVWLLFCKDNQQVFVTHSDDRGVNWSAPREITATTKDAGWKYVASGPGHGVQLSSGRLLVAAWGDASPGPVSWPPAWGEIEFTFAMFSDDHGATWQRGRPMYENLTEEAMVVETADRRVYMALRSLHGKKRRAHAWSDDGGSSWSRIEFDEGLPDPPAHASIIRLDDRRMLLVNPASDQRRERLTARVSEDNGKTWPIAQLIYEGSAAYSDLAVARDGAVICLFEADNYSKMILARIDVQGLTHEAGKQNEKHSPRVQFIRSRRHVIRWRADGLCEGINQSGPRTDS